MLMLSIIDANERAVKDERFIDGVSSVVGNWLAWEIERRGLLTVSPAAADIVFLVHAGQIGWKAAVKRELKRSGVPSIPGSRGQYVITGGAIDAAPLTALSVADALAVGEAYRFIDGLLDIVTASGAMQDIRRFVVENPHAIEREQVAGLQRDNVQPWLLSRQPDILATPDDYVAWDIPVVRSADKVLRMVASKGCHMKCKFCATTYRQSYRVNPNGADLVATAHGLQRAGERVSIVTNDVAALPFFDDLSRGGKLDSQSLTIKAIRDDDILRALVRSGVGIARFGVEGISERVRKAFGKPIPDDELVERVAYLQNNGVNTHLFYIIGAPYEDETDWQAFKVFYQRLAKSIQRGICRIKLSAFEPTAPAPLAYYVSGSGYYGNMQEFVQWVTDNWASRHLFIVRARSPKTRAADLADQLGIDSKRARALAEHDRTTDFAPVLEYAQRMTWEVVGWPLPVEKRWHLSRSYAKWMGIDA